MCASTCCYPSLYCFTFPLTWFIASSASRLSSNSMKPKSEKREIPLSVIKQVNDMLSYTLPVLRSKRVILPYLLKIPSSSRWTFQRWRDIRFICAFSFISIQPNGSVQLLTYSAHRFRDTTNKECHGCRYRSKQRWEERKCVWEREKEEE